MRDGEEVKRRRERCSPPDRYEYGLAILFSHLLPPHLHLLLFPHPFPRILVTLLEKRECLSERVQRNLTSRGTRVIRVVLLSLSFSSFLKTQCSSHTRLKYTPCVIACAHFSLGNFCLSLCPPFAFSRAFPLFHFGSLFEPNSNLDRRRRQNEVQRETLSFSRGLYLPQRLSFSLLYLAAIF